MVHKADMGDLSGAEAILRAESGTIAAEWRAACHADGLAGVASTMASSPAPDEVLARRVVAAIAATLGPGGAAAVTGDLAGAADAVVARGTTLDAFVRQLRLLRGVLHRRVVRQLEPAVAVQAQHQWNDAIDRLAEWCAATALGHLEEAALVDPMTGLFNRRAMERDMARELALAERHGRRLSVVMVDLDGLKQINDQKGHASGDEAICSFAGALRAALRGGDRAYRVGGDEFVVLLPEMVADDVPGFVERIAAAMPPAFSWGSATFPDEQHDRVALLDLADQRLLWRRSGRRQGSRAAAAPREETIVVAPARPVRRRRVAAAAFLAGTLLGGATLASATTGRLPRPVQSVADAVLTKVGVEPAEDRGDARRRETGSTSTSRPVPRFMGDASTPCHTPGGEPFAGTHGEYVAAWAKDPSTTPEQRRAASASPCGRPLKSLPGTRRGPDSERGRPDRPVQDPPAGAPGRGGGGAGPDGAGVSEPKTAPANGGPSGRQRQAPPATTTTVVSTTAASPEATTTTTATTTPRGNGNGSGSGGGARPAEARTTGTAAGPTGGGSPGPGARRAR